MIKGYSIFKYVESKGVPLELILESIKDEYVVDWIDYLDTCLMHNWKLNNTLLNIEFALKETYGIEYSKVVVQRLRNIFE